VAIAIYLLSEGSLPSYPFLNTVLRVVQNIRHSIVLIIFCSQLFGPTHVNQKYHIGPMLWAYYLTSFLLMSYYVFGWMLSRYHALHIINCLWFVLTGYFVFGVFRLRTSWIPVVSKYMNTPTCFMIVINFIFLGYFCKTTPYLGDVISLLFHHGSINIITIVIPLSTIISIYFISCRGHTLLQWLIIYHACFSIYWRLLSLDSQELIHELYTMYHSMSTIYTTLVFLGQ
jgi:hypothetical protein